MTASLFKSLSRTAMAGLLLAAATASQAGVVQMTTRAGAGGVDWGSFGAEFTGVANGDSIAPVTVSGAASSFTVLSGGTFNSDFSATDNVLALLDIGTGDLSAGVFQLDFATAVYAAGAQVQANLFGAFSGFIEAFDSSNTSLGSFAVGGSNSGAADGSAVFAGISSTEANIARLVFSGFGDGAGINALSYSRVSLEPVVIPEPGSLALALLAVVGLAAARTRRAA